MRKPFSPCCSNREGEGLPRKVREPTIRKRKRLNVSNLGSIPSGKKMNLKENLKKISEKVDDLRGIAIAAADGIIVEEHRVDSSLDLVSIVAECGALWKSAEKASQFVELGASEEMTIVTERAIILVKKINPEYFLLLVIASEKNFGKGRFLLRMEAATLVEELS